MSLRGEALAVSALIDWLRLKLPAKVDEVNLDRAVVLKAPLAGPYTVPVGATLKLSLTEKDTNYTEVALTSGSRTTAQLVTEVNTAMGSTVASADDRDRLVLSGVLPSGGTPSLVSLGPDETGANAVFGWDAGGEYVVNEALAAPGYRNVMDGWPLQLDTTGGFLVIVGRRKGRPVPPELRRDEMVVTLELALFRVAGQTENHRSREHVGSCVRCVREVLTTDEGRQLGRASVGDIVLVELGDGVVEAMRFQPVKNGKPFGPSFDSAALQVFVKVFERPAAA